MGTSGGSSPREPLSSSRQQCREAVWLLDQEPDDEPAEKGLLEVLELSGIDRAMPADGSLAFKDWIASSSPIHWLCKMSDRYLTGDDVQFFTTTSAKELLTGTFGPDAIHGESLVRPWSNNVAYLIHR